jgi:hypothetical protein
VPRPPSPTDVTILQEETVTAAGEVSYQARNLNVGFVVAWLIEMVGNNWQAIILHYRSQVLSKPFTRQQTRFSNIFLVAPQADDGINNGAVGTRKATLDDKKAKRER